MTIGAKLREIREAEGLSRVELSLLTDIPVPTMKRYETGRIAKIGSDTLLKFTNHHQFKKYTLWLMSDQIAPESGQISPALSPDGQNSTTNHQSGKKVG